MSIAKKKTSEGAMPADAFISFNGQTGKVKLEIKGKDGTTTKYEPTAIKYLVLDEDFREGEQLLQGNAEQRHRCCCWTLGDYQAKV